MLKNYLLVCLRTILHQRLYSAIKVVGLALGLACCIPILLLVYYQWSYDAFHARGEDIYRVLNRKVRAGGEVEYSVLQPIALAAALQEAYPGIVRATGFIRSNTHVARGEERFWQGVGLVDAEFLQIFSFPLLAGDPATALEQPNAVVIDAEVARKFFGDVGYDQVLGQHLSFAAGNLDFIVTGILAPVSETSSLQFELLVPIEHYRHFSRSNTSWNGVEATACTYVLLAPGQVVSAVEEVIRPVTEAEMGPMISGMKEREHLRAVDDAFIPVLQPLDEVHINDKVRITYEETTDPFQLYALGGIALLVLFIACINFTTLSVGQSLKRVREASMRKVLGAQRRQLLAQFWGEALVLTFFGLCLGLGLAEWFVQTFDAMAETTMPGLFYFGLWRTLLGLGGLLLAVSLLAGIYPALVVSRLQPVEVFRARMRLGGRGLFTRALVVVQYALSIALMIGAALMQQQLEFIRDKNLGFAKEEVAVVSLRGGDTMAMAERFKNALVQSTQVVAVATADRAFTDGDHSSGMEVGDGKYVQVRMIRIDPDYVKALGLELVAGRDLNERDGRNAILVNEKLVEAFGWQDPIGMELRRGGDDEPAPRVVGVVKNYHIDALHYDIQPLALHMRQQSNRASIMVRLSPGSLAGALGFLQAEWEKMDAEEYAAEISFLDERLNNQYREEELWAEVVGYAFGFAILLSCLGLLGLASLTVSRQTREVGIRKVLGAGVGDVMALLSKDFVLLIVVANALAWPLAYWAGQQWLQNFVYRIDIGAGVFVLSGLLALGVALATLSVQTLKAALANPVEALRRD